MNLALMAIGTWIAFDGAFSVWLYRKQSLQEHLIRIVRFITGLAILLIGGQP